MVVIDQHRGKHGHRSGGDRRRVKVIVSDMDAGLRFLIGRRNKMQMLLEAHLQSSHNGYIKSPFGDPQDTDVIKLDMTLVQVF